MAIVGINQPGRKQREPSTLEKVAQALDIATKGLGLAFSIPKFLNEKKLTDAQLQQIETKSEREDAKFSLDVARTTRPAREVGSPEVEKIPGGGIISSITPRFEEGATEVAGFGQRVPLSIDKAAADRSFKAGEAEKARTFAAGESKKGRSFKAGESGKVREFTAEENEKNRINKLETAKFRVLNKPSIFTQQIEKEAGKQFFEDKRALPDMRVRLDDMGTAWGLLQDVKTGPIVGSNLAVALRKTFSGEESTAQIQLLESLLSKEALKVVQAFAKEAGARAIDTNAEREFLLRTTAGINQNKDVVESLLLTTRSLIEQARIETESKAAFVENHGTLEGFISPLSRKETFYNPDNGQIVFLNTSTEGIPPNFFKLSERLKKGGIKPPSQSDEALF